MAVGMTVHSHFVKQASKQRALPSHFSFSRVGTAIFGVEAAYPGSAFFAKEALHQRGYAASATSTYIEHDASTYGGVQPGGVGTWYGPMSM
jgi:hypothetical protein